MNRGGLTAGAPAVSCDQQPLATLRLDATGADTRRLFLTKFQYSSINPNKQQLKTKAPIDYYPYYPTRLLPLFTEQR